MRRYHYMLFVPQNLYTYRSYAHVCSPNRINVFRKTCNSAGPIRDEPSSCTAVPIAVVYSVKGHSQRIIRLLAITS